MSAVRSRGAPAQIPPTSVMSAPYASECSKDASVPKLKLPFSFIAFTNPDAQLNATILNAMAQPLKIKGVEAAPCRAVLIEDYLFWGGKRGLGAF